MASTDPIRWGILGTAGINDKLLGGARTSARTNVVAVASRDAQRAADYAAAHDIPRSFGSYEDLLADPEIEAVYVPLPNSFHHTWTMNALAAGKHVLSEKPYSRRSGEVETAFDDAATRGLVLMEAFMWRHTPQVRRLLEELPGIGALQTIRSTFSFVMGPGENIRLGADLDGGALMDVGCYCVSAARLLAGEEPDLVFGSQVIGPTGVDIKFTGILHFPSEVIAEFTCGFTTEHRGLEAIGPRGALFVPDPWHSKPQTILRDGEPLEVEPGDPYQLELDNMAAAIRGERAPLLGRADALGQSRTIAALYASAASGAGVRP